MQYNLYYAYNLISKLTPYVLCLIHLFKTIASCKYENCLNNVVCNNGLEMGWFELCSGMEE